MGTEIEILNAIKKLNENASVFMEKYNKDVAFMVGEYYKIVPNILLDFGSPLVGKEINVGNDVFAKIKNIPTYDKIDNYSCWIKIPVSINEDDREYNLITAVTLGTLTESLGDALKNSVWRLTTPQDTYVTENNISLN